MDEVWVQRTVAKNLKVFPSDYVGLWEISNDAERAYGQTALGREKTLEVVRVMLSKGVIAVNLAEKGRYTPWPETDPDAVIARIRKEWMALDGWLDPGNMCWFWLPLPGDPR